MKAWWHLDITGYLDSVLKPIFFVVYCFSRQPFGVVTHGLRIRVPDCNNYFQITCTPTNLENETGNGCDTILNNIMHLPSFGSVLGQSAFHSVKYRVNLEHFPGIVWKWRGEKNLDNVQLYDLQFDTLHGKWLQQNWPHKCWFCYSCNEANTYAQLLTSNPVCKLLTVSYVS